MFTFLFSDCVHIAKDSYSHCGPVVYILSIYNGHYFHYYLSVTQYLDPNVPIIRKHIQIPLPRCYSASSSRSHV